MARMLVSRSLPRRSRATAFVLVALAGASTVLLSCGSTPAKQPADPAKVAANPDELVSDRVEAVDAIWKRRLTVSRTEAREGMKNIVWSPRYAQPVRERAIWWLLSDTEDKENLDTRTSLSLRLPQELSPDMIAYICGLAGDRNWTEFAAPAVRSWARRLQGLDDTERAERKLLEKLSGKSAEAAVFAIFAATPGADARLSPQALDRAEKSRRAAWEVLTRLDADGQKRTALLATLTPAAAADPLISDIRACATEFSCVPLTDSQLQWLTVLRDFADKTDGAARRQWWTEAAGAVARLSPEQRAGLRLRHIEPVRWAAANRPQWVAADRQALLSQIADRIKPRTIYTRTGPSPTAVLTNDDTLSTNAKSLSWGDCLAILIIDDALSTEGVGKELWSQAERDMKDTSTEYGGLVEVAAPGESKPFRVTLFPPRPTQRSGDNRFVASDDMLRAGTWALAHYHFHAQRMNNAEYAGPGPGDEEFAIEHGKNCLVFTPVREGDLNVDFFIAGGIKLDLGVLRQDGTRR
jgi:hypothetical protein